jgi:hypothetical protein
MLITQAKTCSTCAYQSGKGDWSKCRISVDPTEYAVNGLTDAALNRCLAVRSYNGDCGPGGKHWVQRLTWWQKFRIRLGLPAPTMTYSDNPN